MKAQSPEKLTNVSDMQVLDEEGFLSRSRMIKAKNIIMTERIWINAVPSEITLQPLDPDTDAQLHKRVITVREEPNLHVESHQRDVTNVQRSGEWLNMESKNQFASAPT